MRVLALACCITWTIRPHKPTYPVRCDTGKWRVQRGQELVWKRRAKQTSNGRAARHVFENLTAIHGWLKKSARWNKACENLNARGLSLSSAPGLLRSFEESTDCSTFINVLSSQQPGGLPRAHAFSCAVRNYALFPEFMRRISLVVNSLRPCNHVVQSGMAAKSWRSGMSLRRVSSKLITSNRNMSSRQNVARG